MRLFASIWFGIFLLAAMVVYASIFSALPPVRGALEMTDMQAFSHWLFVLITILFMLSLFTVTFARMRWHEVNLGALAAHVGLLLLCGGAIEYFGTKVEGNILLQSPRVRILADMQGQQRQLDAILAEKGSLWQEFAPIFGGAIEVRVDETTAAGPYPVDSIKVSVRVGDTAPQQFTLSRAQPTAQINEQLALDFVTFEPRRVFYDDERAAMYCNGPDGQQVVAYLDALPIHRERYLPGELDIKDSNGRTVPSQRTWPHMALGPLKIPTGWFERWRMPIEVADPELPFTINITGYLPYVRGYRNVPAPGGGTQPQPVVEPVETRRPMVATRSMSWIRVELAARDGSWSQKRWMRFSSWLETDLQPWRVDIPGAGTWELIYSREQHDLGAALVNRKLSVNFFPGKRGVESWRSDFRVSPPEGEPYAAAVHTNYTYTVGDWTLFQSGADSEHWRYTILGVGNRNGITLMNLGWIITTLGCLYAFYIKPVILRRMKQGQRTKS